MTMVTVIFQIDHIKVPANLDFKVSVYVQRKCNLNWQRSLGKNKAERVSCSVVEVKSEACELVAGVKLSVREGDANIHFSLLKQ